MDRYKYMKMPIGIFPQHVIEEYHLMKRCTRDAVGSKFAGASMDSLRPENSQINSSGRSWPHMGILKCSTRQAYGITSLAPFNSHWPSMISASNTGEERTQSICSGFWRQNLQRFPWTEKEHCIAVSRWSGTTKRDG